MEKRFQKGQALVLVLLSLSVVLTLVLYILSRTVTDVATSSRDEESVRAFSAAEAGVEQALVIGSDIGSTNFTNAQYSAQVDDFGEGSSTFNYPLALGSGDSASVWFVAHDDQSQKICSADKPCFTGNSAKICWGKAGTSPSSATTPAIEVSVFYTSTPNDYTTAKIARAAYDPNTSRRASNIFSAPSTDGCTVDNETYQFYTTLNFNSLGIANATTQGVLQFARVRMIYNSDLKQNFGVDTLGSVLPSQGLMINSSGVSGDANRRIEVFQGWPEAPSVFDFSVFSAGGLTK